MRGKRILATITALVLLICISACGSTVSGYRQSGAGLGDRSFTI